MEDHYDPYAVGQSSRARSGKALRPDAETSSDGAMEGPQAVAAGQLRAFVERIERVEEEIGALGDDRKEIYAEAKAMGFDTKAVRQLVKLRKQDPAARQEAEAVLQLYMSALGME